MDTSWKSVYNQTFETPNQATVENPDLFTFEHHNLDNFIHFLSTNKLQGNEPFILSKIIKNEKGEKQRLVDEIVKLSHFATHVETELHKANAHLTEMKIVVEKCEREKSQNLETISHLKSQLANAEECRQKLAIAEKALSKISDLKSELEISQSALFQKQNELQDSGIVLGRERQDKDNLQANLFESIAHVESLKNINQDLKKEKRETEELVS